MKGYTLLVSMLLGLAACYEDLGNYDYHEINEVNVTGMSDQVKYTMIDSLIVVPSIDYTLHPEGEYAFEWSAVQKDAPLGETSDTIVIGREKELHYFVILPVGKYIVTLSVTDKANGLIWKNRFDLMVASATYQGWMVLCDDNGKARLDMIGESGGTPMISWDILAKTPMPVKHDPWEMQVVTLDLGASWDIFMLTGEGGVRLVPEDLSWEESYDFPYLMADPELQDCKPQEFCGSSTKGLLMVADGNVYWKRHQGSPLFGRPVNYVNNRLVTVAPFIGYQNGTGTLFGGDNFVLFDVQNKRFLKYFCNQAVCEELTDFPQGYDLVFMQNTTYDQGTTYAILKKDAHYYLFSFLANELKRMEWVEMDIPGLEKVEHFAFDPLYPYLFYTDGLYLNLYNWLEVPDRRIKRMFSLNGQEVTLLKYNMTFDGIVANGAVYPDRFLLMGTVDGEGLGTLWMFEPQPNMEDLLLNGSNAVFTKIIDATYRER